MSELTEFITFGFGQKIGNYPLDSHYMKVNREDVHKIVEINNAGFLAFAFSYDLEELGHHLAMYPHMKEITPEQYSEYKKERVWDELEN